MLVEVWADIICPWCGLGLHRLGAALEEFGKSGEVEVRRRSFQLDPSFPADEVISSREALRARGLADEQIEASQRRIEEMAHAEGLAPYRVAGGDVGNTGPAHELLAYATSEGLHTQGWQTMFRAYFGEGRPVFGLPALLDLAEDIGLDRDGAREALESRRFAAQVDADAREAARLGVRGVPFFVIGRRYGVSGAQPADLLLSALQRAWNDSGQSARAHG